MTKPIRPVDVETFNHKQGKFSVQGTGVVNDGDQICSASDLGCNTGYVDFESDLFQDYLAYVALITSTTLSKSDYEVKFDNEDWFQVGSFDTQGCDGGEILIPASTYGVTILSQPDIEAFIIQIESARYFVSPNSDVYEIHTYSTNGKPVLTKLDLPVGRGISLENQGTFFECVTDKIPNGGGDAIRLQLFQALANNDFNTAKTLTKQLYPSPALQSPPSEPAAVATPPADPSPAATPTSTAPANRPKSKPKATPKTPASPQNRSSALKQLLEK